MRWKTPKYKEGDTRTRTWFALIPVTIKEETRWLERVTVIQTLVSCGYDYEWVDSQFV